jgi:transcriptional regulator with XRE-family HTH domain
MRKFSELSKKWMKDPDYVKEFDALEEEFSVIGAVMAARAKSGIARLESGKAHPSTRTLWKLATATGTKLKISFEPIAKRTRA